MSISEPRFSASCPGTPHALGAFLQGQVYYRELGNSSAANFTQVRPVEDAAELAESCLPSTGIFVEANPAPVSIACSAIGRYSISEAIQYLHHAATGEHLPLRLNLAHLQLQLVNVTASSSDIYHWERRQNSNEI